MRVLSIVSTLLLGGAEVMAVMISNSLHRSGVYSCLCCTRESGPVAKKLLVDVPLIYLNKKSFFDIKAIRALRKLIVQNRVDIVHAHNDSVFTVIISKFFPYPICNLKIVWHDHSGVHALYKNRPLISVALTSWLVDAIIVVDQDAENLFRYFSSNKKKIRHISNFSEFNITDNVPKLPGISSKRIVNVATIHPIKGQLVLVEAFKTVLDKFSDAHLIFVGKIRDEDYYKLLLDKIKKMDMANSVTFLGGREDVPDVLKQVDIGVLCSVAEGTPLALLEYGMAGLPVIATNVGQCSQIVEDQVSGQIISAQDVSSLANSILRYLESPSLSRKYGNALQMRVERKYSENNTMKKIKNIYEDLLL